MRKNIREQMSLTKSLFAGNLEQELAFPYPQVAKEEMDSLKIVIDSVRRFAEDNIDAAEIDAAASIPAEVISGLAEIGLFGMTIPEEYGGYGFSSTAYNRVFEEISGIDASLAVTLGGHQSIGLQGLLLFGTDEQKKRFLPKLASGEWLAGFALTEPGAGSDAAGIQSEAVKEGDHYILNGNKIWITNGGIADFFTVFAKTKGADGEKKITAFAVTRDMEGFSSGKEEEKLGIHGSSTTELFFDNIRVPEENVIGPVGKGFKVAMEVLNSGRLGLAAGCVGGIKKLIEQSVEYAKNRRQFNTPIAKFEMIESKISRMVVDAFALESMVYLTTAFIDRGDIDYSVESAICKVYASEAVWRTASEAMQIAGGIGYSKEYPYERSLRDARINLIYEGTNEILRSFIALAGMQQHAEYLKEVGKALHHPISELGLLTDFALSKIKRTVTREKLENVHGSLKNEVAKLEEYTKELNGIVERVIIKYKKDIIHQGFVLEHISNMAIDLFAMMAVISRVDSLLKEKGEDRVARELTITQSFCEDGWRRVRRNLRQIDSAGDKFRKEVAGNVYETNGYHFDYIG